MRTGYNVANISIFHNKIYLKQYSKKQCCDPLGHHPTKAINCSLQVITDLMAERWSTDEIRLVPGKKLRTLRRKSLCHPSEQEDFLVEDFTYGEGLIDEDECTDAFDDTIDQLSALLGVTY